MYLTPCKSLAKNGPHHRELWTQCHYHSVMNSACRLKVETWTRCHLPTGGCLDVCVSRQHRIALRQMENRELLRKSKLSSKYEIRPLATPTRKAPQEGTRAPWETKWDVSQHLTPRAVLTFQSAV